MRRYKKKELLEGVSTLIKANAAITKSMKADPDGVAQVLASCQEFAIIIGNYIESLGKKYAGLVKLLEDYCENIFRMSEAVPDEMQCRKIAKEIQKQLNQLNFGITCDLPDDKKEVVFLPYKASMWDSLESVWKAADANPDCDAYVVPIPYFDKNPDGSFRQMHYEGDQYPPYVPVTKYEEYDFEAHRPDEIYIHNGYDDWNLVTSVHPNFYSRNLKKYTEKLVYIPYFILGEIDPDNKQAVEGIKHFCFMPGIVNADKVIVQSENMRKIYIREYLKAAKECGLKGEHLDRTYLEQKFLGTGSPKFDKVLSMKREDLEVPDEWLKIIEKPNGMSKKIIFYNNSISALLQHNEKMITKMESVFKIFRENRNEVALLWRPHPLIQATIESMRPQLWKGYKELRDRYIKEGWGIYDDSADLDRAVVLSDAYYGDSSSVVQLYKRIGKPIMLQNVQILPMADRASRMYELTIESLAGKEHEIYAVGRELNVMFRLDLETNEVETIMDMPEEEKLIGRLYNGVCVDKDILALVPYNARKFWYCRLKEKKWYDIDIGAYVDSEQIGKFAGGYIFNEIVYLFGYHYKNILLIDLKTGQIKELFEEKNRHSFWMQTPVAHNGTLFVADLLRNEVTGIDLNQTGNYEVFEIENIEPAAKNGNSGIAFDGEYFYIVKHHGNCLYKWKSFEKAYPVKIDSVYDTDEPFFNGIEAHDRFLFLYSPKGKSYVYSLDGKKSYRVEDKTFYAKRMPLSGLAVGEKGAVAVFDNEMKEIKRFTTALSYVQQRDYLAHAEVTGKAMSENDVIGLEDFIDLIVSKAMEQTV